VETVAAGYVNNLKSIEWATTKSESNFRSYDGDSAAIAAQYWNAPHVSHGRASILGSAPTNELCRRTLAYSSRTAVLNGFSKGNRNVDLYHWSGRQ